MSRRIRERCYGEIAAQEKGLFCHVVTVGWENRPRESIEKTAHREVMQKSGLKIEILRFIGVYSEPQDRIVSYPDNGDVVQFFDVVLETVILEGSLRINPESIQLRFFGSDELPSDIVPPVLRPIPDYLNGRACVQN